jgi:hypothetical protein
MIVMATWDGLGPKSSASQQLQLLKRDAEKLVAMLRDDPELPSTRLDYDQNDGWVLNW